MSNQTFETEKTAYGDQNREDLSRSLNSSVSGLDGVVVVLVYRFLSFWMPSLLGFPVAAYLQRIYT